MKHFFRVLSCGVLYVASCGTVLAVEAISNAATPAVGTSTAPSTAVRSKRSDAEIAAIVVTANRVDIEAGQLALATSKYSTVRQFAQRMITDHGGVNDAATRLVSKLGVTPVDSVTSIELQRSGDENLAKLRGMTGQAFDQAYVSHEVGYHQAVLDEIDDVLIPDALNAELKALLVQVRPAIAAHLHHAQMLKTKLK